MKKKSFKFTHDFGRNNRPSKLKMIYFVNWTSFFLILEICDGKIIIATVCSILAKV